MFPISTGISCIETYGIWCRLHEFLWGYAWVPFIVGAGLLTLSWIRRRNGKSYASYRMVGLIVVGLAAVMFAVGFVPVWQLSDWFGQGPSSL